MHNYFTCRIYGEKGTCLESSSVITAIMDGRVGLPERELDRDAATAML